MTQIKDVREIKETVLNLDFEIKDVRRGLSMYKEQTDSSINELTTTVNNNTTAIGGLKDVMIENNGVLKGIKITFQILVAMLGVVATVVAIVGVF